MSLEDYMNTVPFLLESAISLVKIGAIISLVMAGRWFFLQIAGSGQFLSAGLAGISKGFLGLGVG